MKKYIINNFYICGNYIAGDYIDIHDNPSATFYHHQPVPSPAIVEDVTPDQQPSAEDLLGIPAEGKYTDVRRYIEERKRFDAEFKAYCSNHSLRDLCARLTKEFGWFVDENSLQRNLNRNR